MNEVLEVAVELMRNHRLCDSCFGRQFANLAYGTDNAERGRSLKNTLVLLAHSMILDGKREGVELLKKTAENGMCEVAKKTALKLGITVESVEGVCELCLGKLQEIERIADEALTRVGEYEFGKFLVGAKIPESVIEAEDSIGARFGVKWGETIKSEFTREIGKLIAKKTSKQVDYRKPDITITVSPYDGKIAFQVNPIFVEGQYRKLVAGIPQSKWLCRKCRGKGCKFCGGTGKKYPESVQEILEAPVLRESLGESSKFHARGGEDVDAKVLGKGRPFVLEARNPKKRTFNLEGVKKEINSSRKVEVENLRFVERDAVRRIKIREGEGRIYQVTVEADGKIADENLVNLEGTFKNAVVRQLTTGRVLRRRACKAREKHVYKIDVRRLSSKRFKALIHCQGGLDVKSLVTGNDGRTTPSIGEVLQKKVKCSGITIVEDGDEEVKGIQV